ncbi:DUF4184 family protein [Leifsonia sp. McL0607]|uniref:DUF4184 family protein n=1 Tax=Leifsonia sp. McL0607 TaxID=3415672 RepID=UPI003CF42D75
MPFTVSHAAFALVLTRTRFPFAAVVLGAMVPDFVIFIPPEEFYDVTHSPLGLVLVDLPLAVALTIGWWGIGRPSLALLAPMVVQRRMPADWFRPALPVRSLAAWVWLVAAALVGIVSHVVWDSFTHEGGWMVDRLPFLQGEIAGVRVYSLAQHSSTILGLVVLVVAVVVSFRRAPMSDPPVSAPRRLRAIFWVGAALILGVAAVVGIVAGVLAREPATDVVVGAVILVGRCALLLCVAAVVTVAGWLMSRQPARG